MLDRPQTIEIKGRNLVEGMPKAVTVDDSEIRGALSESVSSIVRAIRNVLRSETRSTVICLASGLAAGADLPSMSVRPKSRWYGSPLE